MGKNDIVVGGVYSVARSKGTFGIVKILADEADKNTVYARTFRMKLPNRIDAKHMKEDVADPDGMARRLGIGIGALPVTSRVFQYWEPELLFTQNLSQDEQENLKECFGLAQPWNDLLYP